MDSKDKLTSRLTKKSTGQLWKLAREVGREAHSYLGFARFQDVRDNFYNSAIAPDHRILPLIAAHFAARLNDQQDVPHDTAHGEGIFHDDQRKACVLPPMETHEEPDPTAGEERVRSCGEATSPLWTGKSVKI